MASKKTQTSGAVRFVLDGEVVTVSDIEPTRTVPSPPGHPASREETCTR